MPRFWRVRSRGGHFWCRSAASLSARLDSMRQYQQLLGAACMGGRKADESRTARLQMRHGSRATLVQQLAALQASAIYATPEGVACKLLVRYAATLKSAHWRGGIACHASCACTKRHTSSTWHALAEAAVCLDVMSSQRRRSSGPWARLCSSCQRTGGWRHPLAACTALLTRSPRVRSSALKTLRHTRGSTRAKRSRSLVPALRFQH